MAAKAKVLSRRDEVKNARLERRDAIQQRWDDRRLLRTIGSSILAEKPVEEIVSTMLVYGKYLDHLECVEAADFPVETLRGLVAYLVRVVELKEMPYDEYLQTDEWKGRAQRTKTRFEDRCALDYSHYADDAHHRTYERRGRERTNDLIALCRACHTKHHGRGG